MQTKSCQGLSLHKFFLMELIHPLAQAYAERFSSPEDDILQQIATATQHTHPQAHMLSGHLQGKFLQFISQLLQPKYILEIGTFTGYSAICLARGLQAGGQLHTIELRDEDAATARQNFNIAGMADKIILHTGNALEIIPGLQPVWDLVFIDADKTGYLAYYKMLLPVLKKGAVIIADNVLFHGQVLDETIKGKNAVAIHAFNEYLQQDDSVEKVFVTLRDGLLLITKK